MRSRTRQQTGGTWGALQETKSLSECHNAGGALILIHPPAVRGASAFPCTAPVTILHPAIIPIVLPRCTDTPFLFPAPANNRSSSLPRGLGKIDCLHANDHSLTFTLTYLFTHCRTFTWKLVSYSNTARTRLLRESYPRPPSRTTSIWLTQLRSPIAKATTRCRTSRR